MGFDRGWLLQNQIEIAVERGADDFHPSPRRQFQSNDLDFLIVPCVGKSSDDRRLRQRAAIDLLEKEFS